MVKTSNELGWATAVCVTLLLSPLGSEAQLANAPRRPVRIAFDGLVRRGALQWLSKAPMEVISGTASPVRGTATVDPRDLRTLKGTLRTPVASMKSGNSIRDRHLQGPTWLDARRWPFITYRINKARVVRIRGARAKLVPDGVLTVRGVSRSTSARAEIRWIKANPKTQRVAGDWLRVKLRFNVVLADHGVKGVGGIVGSIVGSKVAPIIAIRGTLYGHTVP